MSSQPDQSEDPLASYKEGARRRHDAERAALAAREARAWVVARKAADELRRQFGVERVVVFGSLTHPGRFTAWSDIDLAVWGLQPRDTFRAIGVAMDCDREIPVNLVDIGACKPSLLTVIEREGISI
jgi:predicted nucleotidyltransferase